MTRKLMRLEGPGPADDACTKVRMSRIRRPHGVVVVEFDGVSRGEAVVRRVTVEFDGVSCGDVVVRSVTVEFDGVSRGDTRLKGGAT